LQQDHTKLAPDGFVVEGLSGRKAAIDQGLDYLATYGHVDAAHPIPFPLPVLARPPGTRRADPALVLAIAAGW
jgi:hypothetical protein